MVLACAHFRDDWTARSAVVRESTGEAREDGTTGSSGLIERLIPLLMEALAPFDEAREAVIEALRLGMDSDSGDP